MRDFEIRFSGSGGQGLQLSAKILSAALNSEGKKVAFSQSYEPTSRGGFSRADLVVSEHDPDYPLVTLLDYLIVLDQSAFNMSRPLLNKKSVVITDTRKVPNIPDGDFVHHPLPISETALELGNVRVANIVALGALVGLSNICNYDLLVRAVTRGVPPKFLALNTEALTRGYKLTSPAEAQKDVLTG